MSFFHSLLQTVQKTIGKYKWIVTVQKFSACKHLSVVQSTGELTSSRLVILNIRFVCLWGVIFFLGFAGQMAFRFCQGHIYIQMKVSLLFVAASQELLSMAGMVAL